MRWRGEKLRYGSFSCFCFFCFGWVRRRLDWIYPIACLCEHLRREEAILIFQQYGFRPSFLSRRALFAFDCIDMLGTDNVEGRHPVESSR